MVQRGFPNIFTNDLPALTSWYTQLLGLEPAFESDWFVHLVAPDANGVELALLASDDAVAPDGATAGGGGVMLTFVVDDVEAAHAAAIDIGCTIVEPPTDLFYGQRRMVLRDPEGILVDVSSPCPPDQAFLDSMSS